MLSIRGRSSRLTMWYYSPTLAEPSVAAFHPARNAASPFSRTPPSYRFATLAMASPHTLPPPITAWISWKATPPLFGATTYRTHSTASTAGCTVGPPYGSCQLTSSRKPPYTYNSNGARVCFMRQFRDKRARCIQTEDEQQNNRYNGCCGHCASAGVGDRHGYTELWT